MIYENTFNKKLNCYKEKLKEHITDTISGHVIDTSLKNTTHS